MDPPECTGHSHDHDHAVDELGLSLRKYVDVELIQCLNEAIPGSGKTVFKLHDDRLTAQPSVQSDDDPELLFYIPFTEAVTIQSLTIRNNASSSSNNNVTASPRHIKLFTNKDTIDFETARELEAQQELQLLPPEHFAEGTVDYPCRPAGRFQNISSITIFVVDNYDDSGESATEITYIGFKGKGMGTKRIAVDCVYEAQGMPKDHKVPDEYGARNVL